MEKTPIITFLFFGFSEVSLYTYNTINRVTIQCFCFVRLHPAFHNIEWYLSNSFSPAHLFMYNNTYWLRRQYTCISYNLDIFGISTKENVYSWVLHNQTNIPWPDLSEYYLFAKDESGRHQTDWESTYMYMYMY